MRKRVEIEDFVRRIEDVPTLPWVATEIFNRAAERSPNMEDLVHLIGTDPALAIRVLKVANSPFYGAPRGISTIRDAAARLGLDNLKSIVLSGPVVQDRVLGRRTFDWEAFRVHSLLSASASERLALKVNKRIAGDAFMAGLLHDVGKRVLYEYSEEELASCIRLSREEQVSTVEAELQVFGVEHATVGKWVIERWGLPERLRDAVWMHHHPPVDWIEDREGYTLAAVVHIAEALAHEGHGAVEGVDQQVVQALHLTEADLREAADGLLEKEAALSSKIEANRTTEQQVVTSLKKANRELGRMSLILGQESAQRAEERDRNAVLMRLASGFLSCDDVGQALDMLACAIVEGLGFEEVICSFQLDDGRVLQGEAQKPPEDRRAVLPVDERGGTPEQEDSNIVDMVASGRVVGQIRIRRGRGVIQPRTLESLVTFANLGAEGVEAIYTRQKLRREGETLALEILKARPTPEKPEVIQKQAVESQELITLAQIASGIGHDLGNILGVILPTAELIKVRLDANDPIRTLTETIEREAQRAAELTDRLLSISKGEERNGTVLQPEDTVEEVIYSLPEGECPEEISG